ncbi:hypothetical protein F7R91_24895 [Streptomyces luteolifulvus]|uniref:Uncharacterized protein n=1 Tax=Streptomyces luteolifulvus TaxID=2615112 RepID=A0A6H9UUA8_9ACTN|nr:hypothetical protein F7R91_24895 [Streptomyces luteolifulvus]
MVPTAAREGRIAGAGLAACGAQPGRHLPGLRRTQRRPRRFGDVVLVVVVLAHASIVLRVGGPGQGVRKVSSDRRS